MNPSPPSVGTALLVPLRMAPGRHDDPPPELVTLCRVIPPVPIDKPPARYQADLLAQGVTYVAVSSWIGKEGDVTSALLESAEARDVLMLTHHGLRGRRCVFAISHTLACPFRAVGRIESVSSDASLHATQQAWVSTAIQRLLQWKWEQDPKAVRAQDRANARAAREASRVAADAKPSPRPEKASSLGSLARTAWFGDWKGHVPPVIVAASRALVRASIQRLRSRQRSPAKDIAEIARSTRAFNTLDARYDHFITTIEAEAIHAVLCALGAACGIADDVAAACIDDAREW
jgi:hypothetical protein